MRHLALLECAEVALIAEEKNGDGCSTDAVEAILKLVIPNPIWLGKMGRLDGLKLQAELFHPMTTGLDQLNFDVYLGKLSDFEGKLRKLFDYDLKYPESYSEGK